MQHHLDPIFRHHASQQGGVGDRAEDSHNLDPGFLGQNGQFQSQIIQRQLADFEQDQAFGQHFHQLTAQL